MNKAALCLSIAMASPIGVADAGTPQQIYESCIGDATKEFQDICWPADQIEKVILLECRAQLLALLRSMPPAVDKAELAERGRLEKIPVGTMASLLEYQRRHRTCQKSPMPSYRTHCWKSTDAALLKAAKGLGR
ncbi:hypothetical protein X747_24700 [Mesorhizobium sp. LNJC384A00]|uniref:hypothetical protein n=1 Tax=Mesorhizobium sp. LNJC384A00 TaxID=1287268 RepID=UPI0003CF748E|nr:hypothetical protein [Mesorhizobium sp. LNJC384A00]ESY37874.1 hypothetical protein X747_24700 [Mesorhizobium sp. LNJC384A00]